MIALSAIYIQQQGWKDTLIQCVESYIESTRTSFCTDTFSQVLDLYQSIESGVLYGFSHLFSIHVYKYHTYTTSHLCANVLGVRMRIHQGSELTCINQRVQVWHCKFVEVDL